VYIHLLPKSSDSRATDDGPSFVLLQPAQLFRLISSGAELAPPNIRRNCWGVHRWIEGLVEQAHEATVACWRGLLGPKPFYAPDFGKIIDPIQGWFGARYPEGAQPPSNKEVPENVRAKQIC
jgi:hypothetical protein